MCSKLFFFHFFQFRTQFLRTKRKRNHIYLVGITHGSHVTMKSRRMLLDIFDWLLIYHSIRIHTNTCRQNFINRARTFFRCVNISTCIVVLISCGCVRTWCCTLVCTGFWCFSTWNHSHIFSAIKPAYVRTPRHVAISKRDAQIIMIFKYNNKHTYICYVLVHTLEHGFAWHSLFTRFPYHHLLFSVSMYFLFQ